MSGDGGGLPEEHEEHVNHEAWVIPYADLLTLLMAMFIALFAISTVDSSKFKDAVDRLQRSARRRQDRLADVRGFEAGRTPRRFRATATAQGPGTGGSLSRARTSSPRRSSRSCSTRPSSCRARRRKKPRRSPACRRRSRIAARRRVTRTTSTPSCSSAGLVVTVVTDKVLFDSGSADLRGAGRTVAAGSSPTR